MADEESTLKMVEEEGQELTHGDIIDIVAQLRAEVEAEQAPETQEEEKIDLSIEVDASQAIEQVEIVQDAVEEAAKPKFSVKFIKQLRSADRKGRNRTCAGCATRFPVAEMDNGKAELCKTCRG